MASQDRRPSKSLAVSDCSNISIFTRLPGRPATPGRSRKHSAAETAGGQAEYRSYGVAGEAGTAGTAGMAGSGRCRGLWACMSVACIMGVHSASDT